MFGKSTPGDPPRTLGVAEINHNVTVKVDDKLLDMLDMNKNPVLVGFVAFTIGYLLGKR